MRRNTDSSTPKRWGTHSGILINKWGRVNFIVLPMIRIWCRTQCVRECGEIIFARCRTAKKNMPKVYIHRDAAAIFWQILQGMYMLMPKCIRISSMVMLTEAENDTSMTENLAKWERWQWRRSFRCWIRITNNWLHWKHLPWFLRCMHRKR